MGPIAIPKHRYELAQSVFVRSDAHLRGPKQLQMVMYCLNLGLNALRTTYYVDTP